MYRMSKCVHIVKNNEIVVAFNDYNFKVIDLDKDLYSVVDKKCIECQSVFILLKTMK